MSTLFLRRVGNALQADGEESFAEIMKLPFGKAFKAEVKQSRNLQWHKLYWSLCHRIGAAIGSEPENISDLLKIETGHCTIIRSRKHGELRLPKSISFAQMTQQEFGDFFEACTRVIYENWGIAHSDVLDCVSDLLAPKTERRGA